MDSHQLFCQEMAGVKPLVPDRRVSTARATPPSEAQLARRAAAQRTLDVSLDSLSMASVEMLRPCDLLGFKREGIKTGFIVSCGWVNMHCRRFWICTVIR